MRRIGVRHGPARIRRACRSLRLAAPAVLCCAAALNLAGCASPESPDPLPLQEAPPFSPSGQAPPPDRWWTAFDDATLNERIDRALSNNFSLTVAWERLMAARAIAQRERAALYPQLDGLAGAEIRDGSDVDERTEVSLGLEASYEVDLWGRIESAAEAERLRASATAADYRTAAISLSSQVALTWYQLAEARLQLELIGSQVETNETVLEVLKLRFGVGQSGSADVLRQRQLVEATREQLVVASARVEVFEHQLAVLEGRAPQGMDNPPGALLPELPPTPATGLPADLLQRRPDVRGAFLQLAAADEDIAVAVTDQYPRINLAASISTAAENPSGLFSEWLASLAGDLVTPLFDGGQRRAELERTEAVRRQRLAEYGQTVLTAFQEVEDALAQEAYEDRRITSIERQLTISRSTLRQLRTQYFKGAADFIDVLAALREQQDLERSLLASRLNRVSFRIALYRALAGGFETPHDHTTDVIQDADASESQPGDPARG